jgi:uncharacterized protein YggT (Ycf19 family)
LAPFKFARLGSGGFGLDFSPWIALIIIGMVRDMMHL